MGTENAATNQHQVAYVISEYPALSMVFVTREVLHLRERGFDVDVASINLPNRGVAALVADEAREAARTYYVKPDGILGALRAHVRTMTTRPRSYLAGWRLVGQLGRLDPQALAKNTAYFTEAVMVGNWMETRHHHHIHAHLGSQAMTVALFVKKAFGVSMSATVHGPDEFYDAYDQYLPEKVAAADFIVCISDFARSQLMKLSPYEHWHKIDVVRLGVDPTVFTPGPFHEDPNVFEILCVGRLCPAKAQHVLVDAVAALLADRPGSLRLRLVGGGEDEQSLRAHIAQAGLEDDVVMEGPVNQDQIREFYRRADIFCLPSVAEGIPVVLMEAMAMQVPCVTTRITGIPELIRDGRDGLLVAPSNVGELSAALGRLMDDSDLRRTLGAAGRQRVLENYDLRANVDTLATVLSSRLASVSGVA